MRTKIRIAVTVCCTAAVLSLVSGCGGSAANDKARGPVSLSGTGATAPYVLYSKWLAAYRQETPGVDLQYKATGSGEGVRAYKAMAVDFAGSDIPLTDDEIAKMPVKPLHFPTVVGAIVPVYNFPGAGQLKFTGKALADIFSGKIQKWNDPELTQINPGVTLPSASIIVTHRTDASGTTYAFTDYLSQVSEMWKTGIGHGATVQWPVGKSAAGNAGLAELVKTTPYSIGYVELNFAIEQKLSYGEVQNSAGKFRKPDFPALGAAADAAQNLKSDFRISIVNSPSEQAYPICTFTWLIVPSQIPDAGKRAALKKFLTWIYGDGLKIALSTDYGVLQPPLLDSVRDQISDIH